MEEQQNPNYPFMNQVSQEMNRDNVINQTSPEKNAELLEHHLRGEDYDSESRSWLRVRTPLMNDKGVDEVICMIKFFLNQSSTLSNMNEERMSRMVVGFGETLAKSFAMNSRDWALDNRIRTPLIYAIIATIYNTLSRSLGKTISDKELYQGTIQHLQQVQIREQEQKKGFLGGLFKPKGSKYMSNLQGGGFHG